MLAKLFDTWIRRYVNRLIGREVSRLTRYRDSVYLLGVESFAKESNFFESLDCSRKEWVNDAAQLPRDLPEAHSAVFLLDGNFNHSFDIQNLLEKLRAHCNRSSRVVAIVYNSYVRWLYGLANFFGVRVGEVPSTFLTFRDLENLARISGFTVIRVRPVGYFPFSLFGIGTFLNRVIQSMPFFRWFGYASVIVLRPKLPPNGEKSVTVVIPARNEKGNIENALRRMPKLGGSYPEVIFVEGHSQDGTWEEIQRVIPLYSDRLRIRAFRQTGIGKCDAVRLGFEHATGELLTILDADLTMPPELLDRFYRAYTEGVADFVNGNRLVYPMEGQAMRYLNWLGNVFFAKALSFVLEAPLGDSLCGTKLMARSDYQRMVRWRKDFGDFDPFGDFELIFPAAVLGIGLVEIPVRYRARTYGTTNISRFRHGALLFKMTLIGLVRLRAGFAR